MRRVGLAIFCSIACAEVPSAPSPSPDAAAELDAGVALDAAAPMDAAVPCSMPELPVGLRVPEGGRFQIPAEIELDPPVGWRTVTTGTVTTVRAPYSVEGRHDLVARYVCASGERLERALAVEVHRLRFVELSPWREDVEGPSAREHPLLFVEGDRMLLFGGLAFRPRQFTLVRDLWSYDLVAERWTALTTTTGPMLGGGRWTAVDGALLLFGGMDARGDVPFEVHRYEDARWSSLSVDATPDARSTSLGSLVYDAPRDRLISACGYGADAPHCQVLAIDPRSGAVEVLETADGPTPRYGFFAAHDVENGRLVLFSGAQAPIAGRPVNPASDVWALELDETPARWERLLEEDPLVPGRRNGCSAFDPIGQRLFVWGGTADARTTEQGLFAFDLLAGAESAVEVPITFIRPARSSCAAVYDAARRRILFGFGNNSSAVFADLVALEL